MAPDHLLVLREHLLGASALSRAAADGIAQVITAGAPQINHARATAIMGGARFGLQVGLNQLGRR